MWRDTFWSKEVYLLPQVVILLQKLDELNAESLLRSKWIPSPYLPQCQWLRFWNFATERGWCFGVLKACVGVDTNFQSDDDGRSISRNHLIVTHWLIHSRKPTEWRLRYERDVTQRISHCIIVTQFFNLPQNKHQKADPKMQQVEKEFQESGRHNIQSCNEAGTLNHNVHLVFIQLSSTRAIWDCFCGVLFTRDVSFWWVRSMSKW